MAPKPSIEMFGQCLLCRKETKWYSQEGWVFHQHALHWRCEVCGCATQPQRYLSEALMQKLLVELGQAPQEEPVLEIEI